MNDFTKLMLDTFVTVTHKSGPCNPCTSINGYILLFKRGTWKHSRIKSKALISNGDTFTQSHLNEQKSRKHVGECCVFQPVCLSCSKCIREVVGIHKNKLLKQAVSEQKSLSLTKIIEKLTFTSVAQSDALS